MDKKLLKGQLYQELERRAKEEPPPLQRRQGGATIVDSMAVPPSTHPVPSSKQRRSTPKNTNGKNGKPSSSTQKNGVRPASLGQSKTQTPSAKPTPPVKQIAQQSLLPAAPPGQVGNTVDEPFPFPLSDNNGQPAPTQPGVLPMWRASIDEEEGEDLLQ